MSNRGLNFKRQMYQLISKNKYIPHVRSDLKVSIPISVLKKFNVPKSKNLVALLKISDRINGKNTIKIKKLSVSGNSLVFTFKGEKDFKHPIVKVLDIIPSSESIKRPKMRFGERIPTLSVLPKFTHKRSFLTKDSNIGVSIFAFERDDEIILRYYGSKKNITLKNKIEIDSLVSVASVLYFTEGGKVQASFTSSHPLMINVILDFVENISNITRENVKASIFCHHNLKNKKRNLEEFWTFHTGVRNSSKNLHLSKKSKSSCGTLELYFSSQILKELFLGIINQMFDSRYVFGAKNVIRGIFSGDSSPILQTKNFITHHITLNKNDWKFQYDFICNFVSLLGIPLKTVPVNPTIYSNQIHAVVYSDWFTNLKMILFDVYSFNLFNKFKFIKKFLCLRKTQSFLELNDSDIITGREIMGKYRVIPSFRNLNLVDLIQLTPKPNRSYEVRFTERGHAVKSLIETIKDKICPKCISDLRQFNNSLLSFDLPPLKGEFLEINM